MLSIPVQGSETSVALSRNRRTALAACADRKKKQQHISAPFDLRADISILRKPPNLAFFDATFPGNGGFAYDGLFLYVYLNTPPQPPPKSFAGVPVIFAPVQEGPLPLPPPFVLPLGFGVTRRQGSIAGHLNYRQGRDFNWKPLFEAIWLHFDNLKVPITEVIYWGHFVHIVLENEDTAREKLPCQAGQVTCRYLFEKDMKRPDTPQARRRVKDPSQDHVVDDTTYDTLQPGVRISSDYLPGSQAFLSSTLGARVRDADGNDYVTVAAHGFPHACGANVFHALRDGGRLVGQLAGRIGTTDVALVRLSPGEHFSNETFVSDDNAEGDESPLLCGLRKPQPFEIVSLDSPDTGYLDGQVMGASFKKIPSDGDTDAQGWVAVDWLYQGQDPEMRFPYSMCGTVACGTDKKVVSFFQYVVKEGPWKDWCIGTSAEELLTRGFI